MTKGRIQTQIIWAFAVFLPFSVLAQGRLDQKAEEAEFRRRQQEAAYRAKLSTLYKCPEEILQRVGQELAERFDPETGRVTAGGKSLAVKCAYGNQNGGNSDVFKNEGKKSAETYSQLIALTVFDIDQIAAQFGEEDGVREVLGDLDAIVIQAKEIQNRTIGNDLPYIELAIDPYTRAVSLHRIGYYVITVRNLIVGQSEGEFPPAVLHGTLLKIAGQQMEQAFRAGLVPKRMIADQRTLDLQQRLESLPKRIRDNADHR